MPPKQTITKEHILESAYYIVIEKGLQQITARSVAAKLNCSTQPIYWYFSNKQELIHSVYLYINKRYIDEMFYILGKQDFFLEMTKWLMGIVNKSHHLFSILFYYNGFDDENLFDVMRSLIDDNEIISKLKKQYQLGDKGAKYLYSSCSNILWPSVRNIERDSSFENDEQFIDFITSFFDEFVEFAKLKDFNP